MTQSAHLWALGYDDMERAEEVRTEIARLGESQCLILLDIAAVVRYPDGRLTVDGEPFVATTPLGRHGFASFLAGLALAVPPLTGAAVGALVSRRAALAEAGINEDFVTEVEALMQPGTSVLFVLDQEGDREAILQGIRGLGGSVLKTNVDLKRAKLIQSTLTGAAAGIADSNAGPTQGEHRP
jgi:uncharacterized membrane protein